MTPATALITGGTSGIGLETAAQLAESGVATIVINGRDARRGAEACEVMQRRAPGAQVHFVAGDVTSRTGVEALFAAVADVTGERLDVFVHSAGGDFAPTLFKDTAAEDVEAVIRDWLVATILCVRAALPLMPRGGAIVAVASDAAKVPTPGEAVIGAAMAGIGMFARTVAMEAKRDGIRVNVLTPSLVAGTRTFERVTEGGFSAKLFAKAIDAAHLGLPDAADVAACAAFLASPAAARITGQLVSVNGGISAG